MGSVLTIAKLSIHSATGQVETEVDPIQGSEI